MLKDVISQIQEVNMKKKQLEKQFQELTKPALADYGFIPQLYEWFCEALADIPPSGKTQRRREFIFIALYLYEPKSLLGHRIKRGLRQAISDVLLMNVHNITHYRDNLNVQYWRKDFIRNVGEACSFINRKLEQFA